MKSTRKYKEREESMIEKEGMTESEAIEKLKNMRLFMQIEDKNNDCKFTEDDYKANEMAIQALEKQVEEKQIEKKKHCDEEYENSPIAIILSFILCLAIIIIASTNGSY